MVWSINQLINIMQSLKTLHIKTPAIDHIACCNDTSYLKEAEKQTNKCISILYRDVLYI